MHWKASAAGHNTSHAQRSTSHATCHKSIVHHTPPAATFLALAQLLCSRKIMRSNDPSPNAKCGAALKSAATQLQLAARNNCTSSVTEYLEARQTAHGVGCREGLDTIVSRLFPPMNLRRKHVVRALSFGLRLHRPLEGTAESERGSMRRVK